jgi:protein TonB
MAVKKTKTPKQASPLDELIFEGRHKAYGAYQHRLRYKQYTKRGFRIAILTFIAIIVLPGLIKDLFRGGASVYINVPVNTTSTKLHAPPKLPEPPPQKDETNSPGKPVGHIIGKSKEFKDTIAEKLKHDTLDISKDTAMVVDSSGPERMPMFPGGNARIADFIKTHLQYPWAEKESGIQGTAGVTFTVNDDGTLDDIETTDQVSIGINHEAERLINIMPTWWPAKHLNKTLKTRVKLSIEFKLTK